MAVLFDGVDLRLEVAFTTSATSTAWADITPYVRSISWGRGRQRELDQAEPGTLTVELLNTDRRFDTFYTGSPYYPNVTPMRNLRLSAIYNTITYELWRGHVDSWAQSWEQPGFSVCTMSATDDLQLLARRTFEDAYVYEILKDFPTTFPAAWLRLGESEGSVITDHMSGTQGEMRGTISGADTLTVGASNGAIAFDGESNRVLHSECARVLALPVSVEAWFQTTNAGLQLIARQGSGNQNDGWSVQMAFGLIIGSAMMDGGLPAFVTKVTTSAFNDGLPHHVVYVRSASVHKIYVDGVDQATIEDAATSQAYNGVLVGGSIKAGDWFDGVLDEVAVYASALTADQVQAHYAAGTACWSGDTTGGDGVSPVTTGRFQRLLDLISVANNADVGNTVLGGAIRIGETSALEQLQLLATTEGGAMWIDGAGVVRFRERHAPITSATEFTFGDQGGEIGFMSVVLAPAAELLRNEITVTREGGFGQTSSDPTSQTNYMVQGYEQSGVLYANDTDSLYASQWLLGRYKDPVQRIDSVTATPRTNPTASFPALLGLDVADKVGVNVRPTVGTVIAQTSIVEGFVHTVTPDTWTVDVALSPAETRAYMVIGSATLGKIGTGRFGF